LHFTSQDIETFETLERRWSRIFFRLPNGIELEKLASDGKKKYKEIYTAREETK